MRFLYKIVFDAIYNGLKIFNDYILEKCKMVLNSRNMISLMAVESEAYAHFDMLEKYVQEGKDLSDLPIQPLYMMMRSRPYEEIAVFF